jgi:hypothetical protein
MIGSVVANPGRIATRGFGNREHVEDAAGIDR